MSHNPALLVIYALLALFIGEIAYLFYCAYIKDRRKW